MADYYDKDKFTGNRRPSGGQTPPPRRPYQTPPGSSGRTPSQNSSGWYSWPAIIILFAIGAWQIGRAHV